MRGFAVWVLVFGLAPAVAQQGGRAGFYRDPALHGDTIVFSAEGDLWKVPARGGAAMRLTSAPGEEGNARISPDGQTVAFNAEYEGPGEVYTIPVAGGMPQRRTWDGSATALGWTPDARLILSTNRYARLPDPQLVLLGAKGETERLPLATGNEAAYTAGRQDAVLHALGQAVQRYQALQGRLGGEPLALRMARRSGATDGRLGWDLARIRCSGTAASTFSRIAME